MEQFEIGQMPQMMIRKMIETHSIDEANRYLADGWLLLSVGFHTSAEPAHEYRSFVLGDIND